MKVLVVDAGGTHVKILATGRRVHREYLSGPSMTPQQMVSVVEKLASDWKVDLSGDLVTECGLEELEPKIDLILKGGIRGRVVVDLNA